MTDVDFDRWNLPIEERRKKKNNINNNALPQRARFLCLFAFNRLHYICTVYVRFSVVIHCVNVCVCL